MMSEPQATGMLMPQMPTPFITSTARAERRSLSSPEEIATPKNQLFGVLRVRTTLLILSVTVAKSCWPPTIGAGRTGSAMAGLTLRLDLRIGIPKCRQIGRARARVELGEQAVVARLRL